MGKSMIGYTTSTLATTAGVSVHVVRDYLVRGLVRPVRRTPGGHCLFDERALKRLRLLRALFESRIGVDELSRFCRALEAGDAARCLTGLRVRIAAQRKRLVDLERMIDELASSARQEEEWRHEWFWVRAAGNAPLERLCVRSSGAADLSVSPTAQRSGACRYERWCAKDCTGWLNCRGTARTQSMLLGYPRNQRWFCAESNEGSSNGRAMAQPRVDWCQDSRAQADRRIEDGTAEGLDAKSARHARVRSALWRCENAQLSRWLLQARPSVARSGPIRSTARACRGPDDHPVVAHVPSRGLRRRHL